MSNGLTMQYFFYNIFRIDAKWLEKRLRIDWASRYRKANVHVGRASTVGKTTSACYIISKLRDHQNLFECFTSNLFSFGACLLRQYGRDWNVSGRSICYFPHAYYTTYLYNCHRCGRGSFLWFQTNEWSGFRPLCPHILDLWRWIPSEHDSDYGPS